MLRRATPRPHECRSLRLVAVRCLATETVPSGHTDFPPPGYPPPKPPSQQRRSQMGPRPRQNLGPRHQLPQGFGRNQLLPVSDSKRALLESIVNDFDAPIRYAFAYGSGVFEQDGYDLEDSKQEKPMLDFMFAVTHSAHWHSINMHQHPGHYPFHARALGSDYVSRVGEMGPGVWFNAYVPSKGVTIKYGVTTIDNLCSDLLNWRSLYLAGRMHKPLRIIKDDARVRLTQQVNLTSAVRAALLCLPENFTQTELFELIAGISYAGDPRMSLPAENKGKIGNIVRKQDQQFHELYHRLIVGLPGVHWSLGSQNIQQDMSPQMRGAHLRKLPSHLLERVKNHYVSYKVELDETAYWSKMGGNSTLPSIIHQEMSNIVRRPATIQTLKGIVSAGPAKALRYSMVKIGKWWNSSGKGSSSKSS